MTDSPRSLAILSRGKQLVKTISCVPRERIRAVAEQQTNDKITIINL